ncbi:MAG TPA: CHAD domain-containing protein [Mariprofundaceae bacterium]|nr:CHAD domain-containing protein [Mariprofundaceae bacterium]
MAADSGKHLLRTAAGRAARSYFEHLIRQADAACERLHDPADSEALHDFRVAIRRSRSWLKAFNDYVGIDEKELRRLRTLARRSNDARDAEIALMWLQRLGEGLDVAKQLEDFEQRRDRAYAEIRELVEAEWPKLSVKLSAEAGYHHDGPPFSGIALEQATSAHSNLAACLEHVHRLADIEAIHRARIAAKRLRYLLEPFRDVVKEVDGAVELLKQVQDDFGDLHDLHLLLESLATGKGSKTLVDRIEGEKQERFKVIHHRYLGATENDFMGRLGDAIAYLHAV